MAGKIKNRFQSGKADGGDALLVRPSNQNDSMVMSEGNDGDKPMRNSAITDGWEFVGCDPISLINQTGGGLVAGDVVAISAANDEAVALDDVSASLKRFVVALGTIANTARGPFARAGEATAKSTGTIARGQFIRKSATTKVFEDTGVAANDSGGPPDGTCGESLTAAAAGTFKALLYGVTIKKAAGGIFGTGSGGAVTDGGGGTVVRNGVLNFTTYQIGGGSATTLTHDIGRALHIKCTGSFTATANGTVNLNAKGGAGGAAAATGGGGIISAGGGGGANGPPPNGADGSGLAGGNGGTWDGTTASAGGAGGSCAFLSDLGFAAGLFGPGGGGGGGAAGGGAGGAGGGVLCIEAPGVTLTAGYSFTATGSNGASGAGGTGGGGGGGGGCFVLRRRTLAGTFTATVTGGTGGTASGAAAAGGAGAAGQTLDEVLP
jgi:hypothetical protein